jgi:acyl-coenzyme A thioesterase PaaI-like protein
MPVPVKGLDAGPYAAISTLIDQVNKLRADLAALKAAFDGHVHGGVTAGSANTAAVAASPALTSDTITELR